MNIKQFIEKHKITSEYNCVGRNKHMPTYKDAHHYKVTFYRGDDSLTTPYSQGLGIKEDPTAEDVLNCLAMDASSAENCPTLEDFFDEFGYEIDDPTTSRTWRIIQREAKKLKAFLGTAPYNTLLWDIERL